MGTYVLNPKFELYSEPEVITYEIMHGERVAATITDTGAAEIREEQFLPFDLYLEEDHDFETRINNLNNFHHWCASRVLSLDRVYAKEIMNCIGATQETTDRARAEISLSYHCVSLTDIHWVRHAEEPVTFAELNLYDHPLNAAIVPLPLKGKSLTVTNRELAQDLATKGYFPKAWVRTEDGFRLLKDGGKEVVERELLASQICQCFDIPQVIYERDTYEGENVTSSRIITSKEYSMVSYRAYDIYTANHDLDPVGECVRLDPVTYHGMNILDYLTGNTDRHPENWGLLVENATNQPISLYPVMDFNVSFQAYDTLDGANCLTVGARKLTQREAAIEGVKAIGLRMIREVDLNQFAGMAQEREMFLRRLAELQKYV